MFITVLTIFAGSLPSTIVMVIVTSLLIISIYLKKGNNRITKYYDKIMCIQNSIELDGSTRFTRTVEIEVLEGKLYSEDFKISLSGDTLLRDYNRIVKRIYGSSDIIINSITDDNKNTIYILNFSPPLDGKTNSKLKFKIEETLAKGPFLMTKDRILNCITKGSWLFNEPYAFTRFLVERPTKLLILMIDFPLNYNVYALGSFWDVVSGSSNHRDEDEYKRLEMRNCFTKFTEKNRSMCLAPS